MADWPGPAELKQVLDIAIESSDWDETVDRVLSAAIGKVQSDVGETVIEPDDALAQAALRMAELISLRPQTTLLEASADATYQRLLQGHRKRFGFA